MTPKEQMEAGEVMLACTLMALGGKHSIDSLDAMTVSMIMKTGLWRVDGKETPDGKFTLQIIDALGRPLDVEAFLTIKEECLKKAGFNSKGERNVPNR